VASILQAYTFDALKILVQKHRLPCSILSQPFVIQLVRPPILNNILIIF
jgi:hypothetical protein